MRVQTEAVTMEVTISLANEASLHPSGSLLIDLIYPEVRPDHRMKLPALVCRKVLRDAFGYFQDPYSRTHDHRLALAVHSTSVFWLPTRR
jgi:hypothetical protein